MLLRSRRLTKIAAQNSFLIAILCSSVYLWLMFYGLLLLGDAVTGSPIYARLYVWHEVLANHGFTFFGTGGAYDGFSVANKLVNTQGERELFLGGLHNGFLSLIAFFGFPFGFAFLAFFIQRLLKALARVRDAGFAIKWVAASYITLFVYFSFQPLGLKVALLMCCVVLVDNSLQRARSDKNSVTS